MDTYYDGGDYVLSIRGKCWNKGGQMINDILLTVICILIPWLIAIVIMRKPPSRQIVKRLAPIKEGSAGVYDPAMDEDKILRGEQESYFE